MVKNIHDENDLEEAKMIEDYYRFKYLMGDFSDIYMKFISKYNYDSLTYIEQKIITENAIKHNIWSFSKDDIDFVFDTIRMIHEIDIITNDELLFHSKLFQKIDHTIASYGYKVYAKLKDGLHISVMYNDNYMFKKLKLGFN